MRKQGRGARDRRGNWKSDTPPDPPPSQLLFLARRAPGWQCVGAKSVYLGERRNEAGDADQASVGKELGHLGNPADVFLPVPRGEAQVLVKAVTDVVPVQGVAGDAVGDQVLLQSKADRRLPSPGETCSEQARPDRH